MPLHAQWITSVQHDSKIATWQAHEPAHQLIQVCSASVIACTLVLQSMQGVHPLKILLLKLACLCHSSDPLLGDAKSTVEDRLHVALHTQLFMT